MPLTSCPFLVYTPPLSINPGHGRYALIGHHENKGMAPIPPMMRPLPSHCILSFANPQESHEPVHLASPSSPARTTTVAPRRATGVLATRRASHRAVVVITVVIVIVIVALTDCGRARGAHPCHRHLSRLLWMDFLISSPQTSES